MKHLQIPGLAGLLLATTVLTSSASLTISEFLALNGAGLQDMDGDGSDWIEIHNSGTAEINLTGWYLTDDPDNLTKWKVPKGSVKPDEYTVFHASGKDSSSLFSMEVHANFSLSADGEYLALVESDGVTIVHEYAPGFPEQRRDVSYGVGEDGETVGYFAIPTPGKANGAPSEGLVSAVKFSSKRGFYDDPVMLELSSETPGAVIRYTVNGAEPSLFSGKNYTEPIKVDKITTIRASASKSGFITSKLNTHSYFFLDEVIRQDAMSTSVTEDPVYGPLMRDALLEHPAIALVTPDTNISKTSEDPTSVEMIFPDGTDGFQIDAGVKRVGGHSLNAYPKNNMRLYFRSEYGQEKLRFPLFEDHPYTDAAADVFDQLNLRGGSHDSLFYLGASSPPQPPSNGQYLRNRWINDMQFLMRHESVRGRWVHVYINGNYWGHYQLMERPTQDFFASYLGGNKSDYVAVNKGLPLGDSDISVWRAMRDSAADYAEFQRRVDILNYVDYMLLNYYCGNDWDWNPEQNWAGGGPVKIDSGGMKFIAWDSDIIFRRLNDNNLAKAGPHNMLNTLIKDEEFAMLFADRIQKHFYGDGLLTPENVARIYNIRAEQIRLSIVPETARWERGRWTRDNQWQSELDRLNDDFFPNRTSEVLSQFKSKGWSGSIAAPSINQAGGYVESGFEVSLSKSIFARGKIVYTTDGSDPRLTGGTMAPQASDYSGSIVLNEPTTVKARVTNSDGWSPLIEARFFVDLVPASAETLTISKIHYRPAAASAAEIAAGYQSRKDFEFIELMNLGTTAIDLHDVRVNEGIVFDFGEAEITQLAAGGRLFLVRNRGAFVMRYGDALVIAGEFMGSLSNDGEQLQIVNDAEDVLQQVTYNDAEPWPVDADGDGRFLVLKSTEKAEIDNAAQWRASASGETPGENGEATIGMTYASWAATAFPANMDAGPESDPDADGFVSLLEFVFGADPTSRDSVPNFRIELETDTSGNVVIRHVTSQRSETKDVELALEVSRDLLTWRPLSGAELQVSRVPVIGAPGIESVTYQLDPSALGGDALYLRHQAALGE